MEKKYRVVKISIPEDLVPWFERGATPIEEAIVEHLSKTRTHTAIKGLYFNDKDRNELEKLIGKNVDTTGEALNGIRVLSTVKVDKIKISFKPDLLQRLHDRKFGRPFDEFLAQTVTEELERYCGLR